VFEELLALRHRGNWLRQRKPFDNQSCSAEFPHLMP